MREQGVVIAFAIESGSRAWGFPSPDSDYDCRFIYVRPVRDHLRLKPLRDVIEFPIEGLVDTGGWDLKKALLLGLGGNAVVNEWARSPLVYEEIAGAREELTTLIEEIADPRDTANHYRGVAHRHYVELGDLDQPVKLKKVLYLLRPLLCLAWMDANGFGKLPPMDVPTLRAGTDLPAAFSDEMDDLLAKKAVTREMGRETLPRSLVRQMEGMMARFETIYIPRRGEMDERQQAADAFYSRWVDRFDAAGTTS